MEGRHAVRPEDAGVVVEGLDDGADQARDADAVRPHVDGHLAAVGVGDHGVHGLGVLVSEIEDVADLDAPRRDQRIAKGLVLPRIVLVVGRRVNGRPPVDNRLQVAVVVRGGARSLEFQEVPVAEHLGFAGVGQDDELVAHVAADGAAFGDHGDGLESQALEGAKVGDEHLVVGPFRAFEVEVEGIRVLHQELAPAHDAEAGPDLVAELPLDVVEQLGQVPVAAHRGAEDVGDLLLVGGAVQHVALVAVLDAQHLRTVVVVARALAPQIGGLDGRHEHFLAARRVLLLAHDLLDLLEHAEPERQPRIDAGAGLADHAGPQHQAVGYDLCLGRSLLQRRQEILGEAHGVAHHHRPGAGRPAFAEAKPRLRAGRANVGNARGVVHAARRVSSAGLSRAESPGTFAPVPPPPGRPGAGR